MPKPIVRPQQHSIKMIYASYAKKLLEANPTWWGRTDKKLKRPNCYICARENGIIVLKMSWQIWKEVVERFFFEAKDAIIQGETLRLGSNLGSIRAVRIERDFSKPTIDWPETFRRKLLDKNNRYVRIYCTTPDYCKIKWLKGKGVTNLTVYHFSPAAKSPASGKGFKGDFHKALNSDPLLKYKFKYYPVLNKRKIKEYAASVNNLSQSSSYSNP